MKDLNSLPKAEKTHLKLGYMRLSDSAPLIVAGELGYFREFGLQVELIREVSWANLRDKLIMNELDGAQLLSPLPMMVTYGAGGLRANLLTGLVLSLNGNGITLSNRLATLLDVSADPRQADSGEAALRLKQRIDRNAARPAFTFATVHLFSMHTILLRQWLLSGGINPDQDVRIIVLPPEQMSDSLARGIIDGYCVGEPWNTVAVARGIGTIVASSIQVTRNAPEKVLGVTESWHEAHPGTHLRLRLALMKACQFMVEPANREQAAELLSRKDYLDLPVSVLLPSLLGELNFSKHGPRHSLADFHLFWRNDACFPWRSHAEWVMRECGAALARPIPPAQISSLARQCYRTDLYREAAAWLEVPAPDQDYLHSETGSQTGHNSRF